jgi:hypothetical protein
MAVENEISEDVTFSVGEKGQPPAWTVGLGRQGWYISTSPKGAQDLGALQVLLSRIYQHGVKEGRLQGGRGLFGF